MEIYGENTIVKSEVYRLFFNPDAGGHFFTTDLLEKRCAYSNQFYSRCGVSGNIVGFGNTTGAVPVHRLFYNSEKGSHFFTINEIERQSVALLEEFEYEGVGFGAFAIKTSAMVPVFRFFDSVNGGHFYCKFFREGGHTNFFA